MSGKAVGEGKPESSGRDNPTWDRAGGQQEPELEPGSNGGQGYVVVGVSSGVEGGWLASWGQGLARHRGYWVGALYEEGWEESKQGKESD